MTLEEVQFFMNALDYDGQEGYINVDYCGRGMEESTFGIVFDHPTILMNAVLAYIKDNPEVVELIPDFEKFRSDNIAQSTIWY